ncbi:MAG: cupin domain-containing protein [candidate division Zixibacteria bacterium]|nr:cupin domain-containing protein [candidate division Zixibacteria bacterium]
MTDKPSPTYSERRHVSPSEGLLQLPTPNGNRFITLFEHGSLAVEIYAPRGVDPQTPHARDEAYVVVQGSGYFVSSEGRHPFSAGDFLFAAAGEDHRFEDFTDDLVVWVIFYGPDGGEKNANDAS